MQKLNRLFLLLFFITGFSTLLVAQESGNDNADSLQRVLMKDSLRVSDAAITKVFSIRNNFLLRSDQINADSTLDKDQRSTAMHSLVTQTNDGIKNALGDTAYAHYIEMIRRRMPERLRGKSVQPLASQGAN